MTNTIDEDSDLNDDTIRKNIKYGTKYQAFKGLLTEYFEESSIHGFKYICEQKRWILDRIIWLFAVIISFIACGYLIGNIWEKRTNNPVIVAFNEKLTPVWEIPFPSVMICPETKTHTEIFNYTDVYNKVRSRKNITEKEEYYWQAISQICRLDYVHFEGPKPLANAKDLVIAMLKAAPAIDETLSDCYWTDRLYMCPEIFDPVLTEEGICFSFNSLKSLYYRPELYDARRAVFFGYRYDNDKDIKWDLENGYDKEAEYYAFPYRVLEAGDKESLLFTLAGKKADVDYVCRYSVQGFKVTLHTPGEEPLVSKNFINLPYDQAVSLTINPKIAVSEELRHYSPERRQCYYQNERYLRYFKVYTQTNCELEWLANETLAECGCVKFSMPRNLSHPICGYKSIYCVNRVINYISTLKFRREKNKINKNTNCDGCNEYSCLPNCISIDYKLELEHQVPFRYAETIEAKNTYFADHKEHMASIRLTQVKINFKEDVSNGLKRSEFYSSSDFVANCGGLLGLFMGVSILSVVELVYFLTLRLWTNLKARRRVQKNQKNACGISDQSNILKPNKRNIHTDRLIFAEINKPEMFHNV